MLPSSTSGRSLQDKVARQGEGTGQGRGAGQGKVRGREVQGRAGQAGMGRLTY